MSVWSVPARGQGGPDPHSLAGQVRHRRHLLIGAHAHRSALLQPAAEQLLYVYVANFDMALGQLSSAPTQPIQQFKGLAVGGAQWSSDGKSLAYASRQDIPAPINVTRPTVPTILSMETGKVVRELHLQCPTASAWDHGLRTGRQFITRGADLKGRDGIMRIDAETGADASLIALNETCSGLSPSGLPTRSGSFYSRYRFSEREIVQVDVSSGNVRGRHMRQEGQGAGVSPDGRYIV